MLEDRAVPATLTVNTTLDVLGHDNGTLSLRQAILDANAAPDSDTIVVPAGIYTLTRPGRNEDGGLTGDLDLAGRVTIQGAGAGVTIVDAGGLDRDFHVLGGATATLSRMTIQGGAIGFDDFTRFDFNGAGGAIVNEGTLTVRDCTLSGNSAVFGGAIYNDNFGTLTVSNSTLSGNSATDVTGFGAGGAIYNESGTATVSNSTVSENFSVVGDGIYFDYPGAAGGGGILNDYDGTLTVRDSTLSGNFADDWGGGISNLGTLTVRNSTLCSNSAYLGGAVNNFGTLTINNSTLSGNSASIGGGIDNEGTMTVRDSTLSGNSAGVGAGISNYGGTLTVSNSTLSTNSATDLGGGIANFGVLTVRDSTLLGNSAPLGGDLYNVTTVSFFDSIIGDRYDV
jgi:hypothetical protein